jgi:3-oxoacyl-[acyl-carrier-protein] synthase-3
MYAGAVKNENGELTGWNDLSIENWTKQSVFSVKQDTKMLGANIVPMGGVYLAELMQKHNLTSDMVDYYLPHMSSEFFRNQIYEYHKNIGMDIPFEKWFYNLPKVGNVGSASAYMMLEEMLNNNMVKKGDRLLVMVPESARFSYAYMYLTVV